MYEDIDISVDFAGLQLVNPVFLASGTCGYADELADFVDINNLGGFITKSITLKPTEGNPVPRVVETDAGMINAIGLANIGLEEFIKTKIPILEKFQTKVFVNIAGQTIEEYVTVAERLKDYPVISGIELNISCPNVEKGGISFGTDEQVVRQITAAVKQSAGQKVLIVKLSPNVTDISRIAQAAVDGGADAISLINTFRAMSIDIHTRRPKLANRTGGLSGPAIKPIAIYMVNKVYNDVTKERSIPILGCGGIRNSSDAIEFIIAGATAVAVGTWNFVDPQCSLKIIDGMKKYCRRNGISSIRELIGSLEAG